MWLEFVYNRSHVLARPTMNAMTVAGIALVVLVEVAALMMAEGLRNTLASTGSPDNAIVIRNGAENEIQSGLKRDDTAIILSQPEVARAPDGLPIATTDSVVVASLKKRSDGQPSNVNVRGVSAYALVVRKGIAVVEGRLPQRGTREVMVGSAIKNKFNRTGIGQAVRLAGVDWPIVGIFDAGNSGFNSEIWGDVDVLMPSFKREQFSSITFRLAENVDFSAFEERMKTDPRMSIVVRRESQFYESQSRTLALFITYLGGFISIIFSLGAIIGALITMYGAVNSRTREIGILRALGFGRLVIFRAFVSECVMLAAAGGVLGVLGGLMLSFLTITTTNFQTFAEVSFKLHMTPLIALQGVIFAFVMGLVGGALPAAQAARIKILQALRDH